MDRKDPCHRYYLEGWTLWGTYVHKDIAFEFAMWISPEFKVYLIREFQRLKNEEQKQLGWTAKQELSKINYRIHSDAIKQNLIPEEVTALPQVELPERVTCYASCSCR